MRVIWTKPASQDLYEIVEYIRRDNVRAPRKVAREIVSTCANLELLPNRGRPGNDPGTRELVLVPYLYVVSYRVRRNVVEILTIWHGAQQR